MNDSTDFGQPAFSIAAVERDTGLGKDTLRVWEKRYGFPQPLRDDFGERLYPIDQVEKLRVIKRLLDNGHRPGKVIKLSIERMLELAEACSAGSRIQMPADTLDELKAYMDMVKSHDADRFKQVLTRQLLNRGLRKFVVEVVAPLNTMVGDAWARGYFEVFEEHLYTETIQVVLRNAISTVSTARHRPKVLMTTLPGELHGLGLLMAECIFSIEGAECVSLGTQTPIYDIVMASKAHAVDIVALSFSPIQSTVAVLDTLSELRAQLPAGIEIWCGGSSTGLRKRAQDAFVLFNSLNEITESLERWRSQHPASERFR